MTDLYRRERPLGAPILPAIAAALAVFAFGPAAHAAEWIVPPGINVASQESVLKERAARAARGLVGENLIDVVVHIGYVRLERRDQPQTQDRVKLPGFNNFIVSSGAQQPEIVSEFTRVRQVFVMVSENARIQPESLGNELGGQLGMDPAQGDTLRVIQVNAAGGPGGEGTPSEPKMPAMEPMPGEPKTAAKPPVKPLTPEELKEPKSTAHLMQARRRYFAGDYQGSLDEILQAITIDPDNAQAYGMLGSLYYAMNWKSLAVKYWQRSLELDPTNREIEDLVTKIRVQGP